MELARPTDSEAHWDALVVGSGPAGLATAIACADSGLRVAILTPPGRSRQDRAVPLETLHPEALRLLVVLGAHAAALNAQKGDFTTIVRNGRSEPVDSAAGRWMHIARDVFDNALSGIARERGVSFCAAGLAALEIRHDHVAARLSDERSLRARWLVDASGRRRIASRLIGHGTRRLGPALVTRTGLIPLSDTSKAACTSFDSFEWGWIWCTAEADGVRTWTALHAARGPMPSQIAAMVHSSVRDSVRVDRATWLHSYPVATENFLAVGDAAGTVDPASGQGLLNAIASGMTAARTIMRCREGLGLAAFNAAAYHRWFVERLLGQARQLETYYRDLGVFLAVGPGERGS